MSVTIYMREGTIKKDPTIDELKTLSGAHVIRLELTGPDLGFIVNHPHGPFRQMSNSIHNDRPFSITEDSAIEQVISLLCAGHSSMPPLEVPSFPLQAKPSVQLAAAIDVLQDFYNSLRDTELTDTQRSILEACQKLEAKGYSVDRILGILDAEGRTDLSGRPPHI